MDPYFLAKLDGMREIAGVPFHINSGYRCATRNTLIGGKEDSAHTKGHAVDISAMDSATRFRIIEAAFQQGFNRIGIASTFIHVDDDTTKPPCVAWVY